VGGNNYFSGKCLKPNLFEHLMKLKNISPLFGVIPIALFLLYGFIPVTHKRSLQNNNINLTDSSYYIIVDKSDYELKVFDGEGWYATYPIVFGSKDLSDKFREGDKRTPNGTFKIILKKIHPKWGPELLLDYPNEESVAKFNQRKASGQIPSGARIGNGIAIHATRPQEEWTVDQFYNWTDGCVSVKYTEMQDLFSYIPVGTKVTIQP
jgi:murein L,D-transpeptidase YafK